MLLLHGLAGEATEWASTADWLVKAFRVFALDQRGHGMSDKGCGDFSRSAYVEDVATVVRSLGIAPLIVIGQSMGALNAYLAAARYPELVRALVLIEAGLRNTSAATDKIATWLDSWPVPFSDREEARRFFGADTLAARTWANGLVQTRDGYRPVFRRDDMVASTRDFEATSSYESEWSRVRCPALLVLGENSWIDSEDVHRMRQIMGNLMVETVSNAGHDVHLDNPDGWREAALRFLAPFRDRAS